jgi:hypothetical protein
MGTTKSLDGLSLVERRIVRAPRPLRIEPIARAVSPNLHPAAADDIAQVHRGQTVDLISSAARPPIIYDAALVPGPEMIDGITAASATRSPRSP